MKKLLPLLLILTSCVSLNTKELVTTKIYNKNITTEQFDSIKLAEKILSFDSVPVKNKYDKWMYEYYYIKDSLVLRAIKDGDSIHITKRINK